VGENEYLEKGAEEGEGRKKKFHLDKHVPRDGARRRSRQSPERILDPAPFRFVHWKSAEGSFLNGFSRLREKFVPTRKICAYKKNLRLQEKFAPILSWRLGANFAPMHEVGA
jgi:hypothetical protein